MTEIGKREKKLGILGKDLFDLTYEFFHFKALFSNDDIEIEEKNYKHGRGVDLEEYERKLNEV